jgi:hypothetical protein
MNGYAGKKAGVTGGTGMPRRRPFAGVRRIAVPVL